MEIIGHARERSALRKVARREKMAQSYLFSGPSSIGKSLIGLEFAAELTGMPDFSPSPEMPHPADVMIIKPEEETKRGVTKQKKIGAESLRKGLAFLSSFPSVGRFRVLLISRAELLSETAANALLKTLEEPNPTSVIILITSDEGSMLPTILSRVEKVRFSFVPVEVLEHSFAHQFSEESASMARFFYSLGRPGLLMRAVENEDFFVEVKGSLGPLFRLSSQSLSERLALAEVLSVDVPATTRMLEWWLPGLHSMALKSVESGGTSGLFLYLESVEQTLRELKTTQGNARLLLEKLFLKLS